VKQKRELVKWEIKEDKAAFPSWSLGRRGLINSVSLWWRPSPRLTLQIQNKDIYNVAIISPSQAPAWEGISDHMN
jgi:hypothetical protein